MKTIIRLLLTSSALSLAAPAFAQTAAGQEETVTVTGSHIVGNPGFQSPTAVTAISQEALQTAVPSNLPDALNQLPAFRNSNSNSTSATWDTSSPNQGNYLNLRNLGTARSLILLDGARVPATSFAGGVDVNTLPQALIQRVDVVTGGASAAYGSDAVVGVVNFILDKNFNGIKGNVQTGLSKYGDDPSYQVTLSAGTPFAGGRGHIEGSFDHYFIDGIHDNADRPRGADRYTRIGSGTASIPHRTYVQATDVQLSTGGTIDTGPLAGYQFTANGVAVPVTMGLPTNDPADYMVGGSGGYYQGNWLTSRLQTDRAFTRVSYDVLDNVTAYLQLSGAMATNYLGVRNDERYNNTSTGITIFSDNPYLAPSTVAALGGTESFQVGRISTDMPLYYSSTTTSNVMVNVGLDGQASLLGHDWHWDARYIFGQALLRLHVNEFNNQRFYAAIDAVRDPSTGNIVCGVTLRNPSLLPGCVPMDILGVGQASQSSIDWVMGYAGYRATNSTSLFDVDFSGTLIDLPAGPLAVAFGAESRRQTLVETSPDDPANAASVDYTGIRGVPDGVQISDFTNVGSARGAVKVNEGYLELNAPLLKDLPLASSLEVNAAGRYTDYSTSGSVTTWKLGVNWVPVDGLRFHSTLSRDIAAPSLYQLFAGTQIQNNNDVDPHTNSQSVFIQQNGGNPDLKPEKAMTFVAGFELTPDWLPGFMASVDYYHLKIKDAIGTINVNTELAECEQSNGTSPICDLIIRPHPFSDTSPDNFPTKIIQESLNQAVVLQEGVDFETDYNFDLADVLEGTSGRMDFHSYIFWQTAFTTQATPGATFLSSNGYAQNPKVSGLFSADYSNGAFSMRIGERYTGFSLRSNTAIYATYATEPGVWYTDLNISYDLDGLPFMKWMGGDDLNKQVFFNVQNLFDRQPPLVADCCNPGLQYPTDREKYDVIGSYYTIGLRLKY